VISQAIQFCFDSINVFPEREFLLRVSYLEVYNEQVKDLLNISHGQSAAAAPPIKILFDPKVGTVLAGVKEHVVFNPQQVYQLIRQGEQHRHVGVTDMNAKSSRAHTLFKIIIESKERITAAAMNSNKPSPVRVSTLNLVDLAGSENAKMTNSMGERAREAKHINQSLLTLSTIIHRLSEDQQLQSNNKRTSQHLPYRDSKLTRLLESALDGNARIAIICNISPTGKCMEESVNTLKFGARAKLIRIHAKINENLDDKTLLRAYREEIEALRNRLKELELKQQQQPTVTVAPSVPPLSSSSEKGPEKKEKPSSLPPPLSHGSRTINREQEGQLDDNNSIEVNSSTENIQETIHQIEDKILHSQSFYQGSGGSVGGGGEEQQKMLQLIVAMEKLILKADNNNKSSSKSFRVKGGDISRSMDITGGLQEGNGGTGKSFKKSSSFITSGGGGAVVPGVRSQIPRRSSNNNNNNNNNNINNTISRSASNDKSMDNESVLKLSSADLDGLKVGSSLSQPTTPINEKTGLKSPNSSSFLKKKKENQKNFFFKPSVTDPSDTDNNNNDNKETETRPPISAESFENLLLETPDAEDEEKHKKKTKIMKGEEEKDEEATDKLLKRNASIPFDDLQENFQKLGNNAERVLGLTVPRSGGNKQPQQRPEEDEQPETIEKQRSISPLTMCSSNQEKGFHSSAVHASAEKPEYHPMEGIGGKEQTASFPHSPSHPRLGIAASASASHDHQQLLNTLSSMSAGGGGLLSLTPGSPLPMKNRIKRVKYAAEEGYMITTDTNPSYDTMDGSLQSNYQLLDREIEDDSVLLGVSKMLTLLKEHILRPKTTTATTATPATATTSNENHNNINNNKTSR
jgi:hypothetical protein